MIKGIILALTLLSLLIMNSIVNADEWAKDGFSPDMKKAWQSLGVTPKEAERYREMGVFPYQISIARWMKENKCKGSRIDSQFKLINGNPFSMNGRCFNIGAEVFQYISSSKALISLNDDNDSLAYIDFGAKKIPGKIFTAYVKVVGHYKYLTTGGSVNTVPLLIAFRPSSEYPSVVPGKCHNHAFWRETAGGGMVCGNP